MTQSLMHRELHESPKRLAAQLASNVERVDAIGAALADRPPTRNFVVGRGTSDHAGAFYRYAAGLLSGQLVDDLSPSLITVYERQLSFERGFLIAISQSGAGSDINHVVSQFGATGGVTLGLTNNADSELARTAHYVLPLSMGPEKAIAATKTFLGSLAALTHLLTAVNKEADLQLGLFELPERLESAAADAGTAIDSAVFSGFMSPMFVIGRGIGLPIAREVALKFKEVCVMHAEAYSAAEFKHGPLALVGPECPMLLLCLDDQTRPQIIELAREVAELGAPTVLVGPDLPHVGAESNLVYHSLPSTGSVYTDAVMVTFQLYDVIERLAILRGHDPDQPAHIQKITSTY